MAIPPQPVLRPLALALAFVGFGCAAEPGATVDGSGGGKGDGTGSSATNKIVEFDDRADDIWAISDPHGGIDALTRLLSSASLIDANTDWSAGPVTLVVAGDLIDKGSHSLEVIDLLRKLQSQAGAAGGRAVILLGNHEAEFLADPNNNKATSTGIDAEGIDIELAADGISPQDFAAEMDSKGRGFWLANLPVGARIKKYFFAHGGNTNGNSVKDLRKLYAEAFTTGDGFGDKDLIGSNSILEAQGWYGNDSSDSAGRDDANALGVNHIVFGHDPGAFNEHDHIAISNNGVLIKIDCAMGLAGNPGQLLHISTNGTDHADKVKLDGSTASLY